MIVVYTKDNCPKCVIEKNKLNATSTPFKEVHLDYGLEEKDPNVEYISVADFKALYPTVKSMPHIVNL